MLKTYTNNPDFVPSSAFLSDAAMVEMYDGRPTACVDILIIDRANKTVLLPTRLSKPAEGLWFIGGGIKRDQEVQQAAAKALQREAGLEITQERFSFLSVNRFVWDYRGEAPQENGRVDLNFCFTVELTTEELSGVQLNDKEYAIEQGLASYNRRQLTAELQNENSAKQVLLDYYDHVFKV